MNPQVNFCHPCDPAFTGVFDEHDPPFPGVFDEHDPTFPKEVFETPFNQFSSDLMNTNNSNQNGQFKWENNYNPDMTVNPILENISDTNRGLKMNTSHQTTTEVVQELQDWSEISHQSFVNGKRNEEFIIKNESQGFTNGKQNSETNTESEIQEFAYGKQKMESRTKNDCVIENIESFSSNNEFYSRYGSSKMGKNTVKQDEFCQKKTESQSSKESIKTSSTSSSRNLLIQDSEVSLLPSKEFGIPSESDAFSSSSFSNSFCSQPSEHNRNVLTTSADNEIFVSSDNTTSSTVNENGSKLFCDSMLVHNDPLKRSPADAQKVLSAHSEKLCNSLPHQQASESENSDSVSTKNSEQSEIFINNNNSNGHIFLTTDFSSDIARCSSPFSTIQSVSSLPSDTITINVPFDSSTSDNELQISDIDIDTPITLKSEKSSGYSSNHTKSTNRFFSNTCERFTASPSPVMSPIFTESCTITPLLTDVFTPNSTNPTSTPLPSPIPYDVLNFVYNESTPSTPCTVTLSNFYSVSKKLEELTTNSSSTTFASNNIYDQNSFAYLLPNNSYNNSGENCLLTEHDCTTNSQCTIHSSNDNNFTVEPKDLLFVGDQNKQLIENENEEYFKKELHLTFGLHRDSLTTQLEEKEGKEKKIETSSTFNNFNSSVADTLPDKFVNTTGIMDYKLRKNEVLNENFTNLNRKSEIRTDNKENNEMTCTQRGECKREISRTNVAEKKKVFANKDNFETSLRIKSKEKSAEDHVPKEKVDLSEKVNFPVKNVEIEFLKPKDNDDVRDNLTKSKPSPPLPPPRFTSSYAIPPPLPPPPVEEFDEDSIIAPPVPNLPLYLNDNMNRKEMPLSTAPEVPRRQYLLIPITPGAAYPKLLSPPPAPIRSTSLQKSPPPPPTRQRTPFRELDENQIHLNVGYVNDSLIKVDKELSFMQKLTPVPEERISPATRSPTPKSFQEEKREPSQRLVSTEREINNETTKVNLSHEGEFTLKSSCSVGDDVDNNENKKFSPIPPPPRNSENDQYPSPRETSKPVPPPVPPHPNIFIPPPPPIRSKSLTKSPIPQISILSSNSSPTDNKSIVSSTDAINTEEKSPIISEKGRTISPNSSETTQLAQSPPTPPPVLSPNANIKPSLVSISPYGKIVINRCDLPLPSPEEEIRKVFTNAKAWGWIQVERDTLAVYTQLRPVIQQGPQCGLVALSMASQTCLSSVALETLLEVAKSKNMTHHGEMFSAKAMADLANSALEGVESQVKRDLLRSPSQLVKCLLEGDLILFPYDAEHNHTPGKKNGRKAHWGVLCGCLVQIGSDLFEKDATVAKSDSIIDNLWHVRPKGQYRAENLGNGKDVSPEDPSSSYSCSVQKAIGQTNICNSSSSSLTNIGSKTSNNELQDRNISESPRRDQLATPIGTTWCDNLTNTVMLWRQGKSRNLISSPVKDLQESNEQLLEYNTTEDYVIDSVEEGLARQVVVIHKIKQGLSDLLCVLQEQEKK